MREVLRVAQPGILTTIQDAGRPNAVASGVPPGGAMDRFAHFAANLLVGNERGAAALECTLKGPRLAVLQPCTVAITGADFDPRVNGASVPSWTAIPLAAGDELAFGGRRAGARAYIAVDGGVLGDRWLGSLSTNLMCARGGMHGRALAAQDVVSAGEAMQPVASGRTLRADLRPPYGDRVLQVIPGPHFGRLDPESQPLLFSTPFTLSHDSNRMGYRLNGPRLEASSDELLSFGVLAGVVQLPIGGQPIILMADHQTAGGYPVIATVISASMPVAAQLAPGDEVRFVQTSIEDALRARTAQRETLESLTS
ncbi:MAG TPA: biotin-dependent carboxyltransferase family protein [Candidatus Limnocylindrales bacterium]|nr:biotin-dependent carboxyltransferase family protein [Candidatus Limnocylindrales bacterium]